MTGIVTDWRRRPGGATRRAWLGLGGLAVLLAGCGRKGNLYLPPRETGTPQPSGEAPTEPPTTDTVPEELYDQ